MRSPSSHHLFLLCLALAACRDLKQDPDYCPTCSAEGSTEPQGAAGIEPGATAGVSSASQGQTGTAAGNTASMTAPAAASGAGSSAAARAGAGASVAGTSTTSSVTGGRSAGGAATAGSTASSASGSGGSKASSGEAGGSSGREPAPDAGPPPMTSPCGRVCDGQTPVCDTAWRNCVECNAEDANACNGALKACDLREKKCVECVDDKTCSGDKPVCDVQAKSCVTCMRSIANSCRSALPVCDEQAQQCVECMPGQTQACTGNRKQCDPQGKMCVECLEQSAQTDCPSPERPACDLRQHACTGCMSQSDCRGRFPDAQVCDANSHTCVRCVIDSDCGTGNGMRCNVSKHTCEAVQLPPGTKKTCEVCAAENECIGYEDKRAACLQNGKSKHCFPSALNGQCEPGFNAQSGFCVPRSSCEAVNAIGTGCTQQQSSQCGDNGVCIADRCTIHCNDQKDCPNGRSCMMPMGGMDAQKYCM